jgi:hypothetical protein
MGIAGGEVRFGGKQGRIFKLNAGDVASPRAKLSYNRRQQRKEARETCRRVGPLFAIRLSMYENAQAVQPDKGGRAALDGGVEGGPR